MFVIKGAFCAQNSTIFDTSKSTFNFYIQQSVVYKN